MNRYYKILVILFSTAILRTETATGQSITQGDTTFLLHVQKASFDFFWNEANPTNGLIKDNSRADSPCSIASVGFGLTAICVGVDQNWITREAGRQRVLTTLNTFWTKPQGRDPQGYIGYKGLFYHFLDMNTALRLPTTPDWKDELSSIDSALLLAGILYAKQYFNLDNADESQIRALADSIYYRVDWQWMRNYQPNITLGWHPETGFINAWWRGYNEAMIMNILALGSPTHPAPASTWSAWTSGYSWQTHYNYSYVNFPPLFGHQYSHCWIDFRNIQDSYMKNKGITYFENSHRATLAQREYCIANPGKFKGYGENIWGITASDGHNGYKARGAPPAQGDDGTISPTAAAGSIPFAPEVCIPALKYMYDTYRQSLWLKYGFCDAFNLTVNWWSPIVIGIDQGPFVLMIENYLTGKVWDTFMRDPDIQRGLQQAGFFTISGVQQDEIQPPKGYALYQNYPNPFNSSTMIRYFVPESVRVKITIFDILGQEVATLVDETKSQGEHSIAFDGSHLASGIYFCQLAVEAFTMTKKMVRVN